MMITMFLVAAALAADPPDPGGAVEPAEGPAEGEVQTGEAAEALASRVAARCGDPYDVEEIAFTFVVEAADEEKVRRSHRWRPRAGTLEVDGAQLPVDEVQTRHADTWAAFVNDSYWLLAPCKVGDPGVNRAVVDGRLQLTFDGVGLTPGDRYLLSVDEAGRVVGWDFVLQSGREGAFTWTGHERFGPLELSTRRESAADDTVIRFEEVSVTP